MTTRICGTERSHRNTLKAERIHFRLVRLSSLILRSEATQFAAGNDVHRVNDIVFKVEE